MSNLSSMLGSIADENDKTNTLLTIKSISKQYNIHNNTNNDNNINNNNNIDCNNSNDGYESDIASKHLSLKFRAYTEILFDLFPSIFLPYTDVYTFCNLLKTDLWDWRCLLSDRIIFDYCHYLSIRNREEIEKFCQEPFDLLTDTESYDSSDTIQFKKEETDDNHIITAYQYDNNDDDNNEDDEDEYVTDDEDADFKIIVDNEERLIIKDIKDEEQNFAILKFKTNGSVHINNCDFIFNNFKNIDIISDRMSLTEAHDIGLSSNLCKTITINDNFFNNNNDYNNNNCNIDNDIIFVYDTFDELKESLICENYFSEQDLKYINNLLLIDILSICPIDKWYFVEWHEIKGEYIEYNQTFPILEIKQMIVAHLNIKNKKNKKNKTKHNNKEQLFISWSIEWQQFINDHHDINEEVSISSSSISKDKHSLDL